MFDIGFSELILIAVVGLLVIGPERLPETIRVTTRWLRNIRRSFEQAKREVEQELGVNDIKRELHNEEVLNALNNVKGDLQQAQQALSELPYDISQTANLADPKLDTAKEHPAPATTPSNSSLIGTTRE
jgi:sec-independent protein translocase protein TatB